MRSAMFSSVVALAATSCFSTSTLPLRPEAGVGQSLAWPLETKSAQVANVAGAEAPCATLARTIALRHPQLRAARARANGALARARAAAAPEPPHASVEVWDFPIGAPAEADREGMYMLGVSQAFEPLGAREALSRAEAEEARATGEELSETAREVWAEAARACTAWSTATALRTQLMAHRRLLVELREAMLTRYQAGGETLGMVARADAELAAGDRHVAEAEEEVAVSRDVLEALADGQVPLPGTAPGQAEARELLALESLLAVANASRGSLKGAQARRRSAVARAEAADAEANAPSMTVRGTYMQSPASRPGLGLMFEMSLPWLWGPGRARQDVARHDVAATEAEFASTQRAIRLEVTRAAGQVRALSRSLAVLIEREIPAAQRALEAERATLAAGEFNLTSWIQAAHALRQAHVDEARVRGALASAWIELESSVGKTVAPLGAERQQP